MVRVKWMWWAIRNRRQGYKLDPVQRYQCCGCEAPFHYHYCPNRECGRCGAKLFPSASYCGVCEYGKWPEASR